MPIALEVVTLMLLFYLTGLALGWIMWGRNRATAGD